MSIESLEFLSKVAYIASIVFLVITFILFFVFNIPRLFAEVTGRARKKEIETISKSAITGVADTMIDNKRHEKRSKTKVDKNYTVTGNLHSNVNDKEESVNNRVSAKTTILRPDMMHNNENSFETVHKNSPAQDVENIEIIFDIVFTDSSEFI